MNTKDWICNHRGTICSAFIITIIVFIFFAQFKNTAEVVDKPLNLTTFIESGSSSDAQNAALVRHKSFGNVETFAGYLTVNQSYNKNLFFWFCPSQSDYENDPVVLWLQGGPGGSSVYGLLKEHGPFSIQEDLTVKMNPYTWSKFHNVLYIDNPAGTGYSFTDEGGLDHSDHLIGTELFEALRQFFILFPELRKNELFVTGESYAGKYVPSLCHTIHMRNLNSPDRSKMNLKGLAIGNGKVDPVNQLDMGEYVYQHGLIDFNTKTLMDELKQKIIELINSGQFNEAGKEYDKMMYTLEEATGFTNLFNYLYPHGTSGKEVAYAFVQKDDIRRAIHVGNATFHSGDKVSDALNEDYMKSVIDLLPILLENYRVLLYNGQLDLRLPYPCMVNFIRKLNFTGAEEYKTAQRTIWHVKDNIAGYAKVAGNLTELLILNAGHMVPTDQPEGALDMIHRFTRNKRFK